MDLNFTPEEQAFRAEIRAWVATQHRQGLSGRSLQRRLGVTTIMVTHDQEEALSVADRIVVMNHGRIEQVGTPLQVYREPASPFVADFVGRINVVAATTDRNTAPNSAPDANTATAWPLATGSTVASASRPLSTAIGAPPCQRCSRPAHSQDEATTPSPSKA